ncbi:unnamed protein product [Ixodes pacificus]
MSSFKLEGFVVPDTHCMSSSGKKKIAGNKMLLYNCQCQELVRGDALPRTPEQNTRKKKCLKQSREEGLHLWRVELCGGVDWHERRARSKRQPACAKWNTVLTKRLRCAVVFSLLSTADQMSIFFRTLLFTRERNADGQSLWRDLSQLSPWLYRRLTRDCSIFSSKLPWCLGRLHVRCTETVVAVTPIGGLLEIFKYRHWKV